MTGSGPTLLALYPSSEEAKSDYHRLSDERLLITSLA
jgi:4-diphosphocytidyl-2C-methyl-D-erythritol kinase